MTSPPPGTTSAQTARPATGDGFRASRHRQGDVPAGLIGARAIRGALRRRAWLLCAAAAAGLAAGGWLYVAAPPAYQAATSILVTNNPNLDPASQMQGDADLAQSLQVASGAVRRLGLHQSVTGFAHSYTVSALTDQLLQITASATSATEAERRANALAAEFMQYRAELLAVDQRLAVPTINRQIKVVQEQVAFLGGQMAVVSRQPPSAKRKTDLKSLTTREGKASATLGALNYEETNYPVLTQSMIRGTAVLDVAAPIPPSRRHIALMTGVAGLVAGLALGLLVVLVETVASDRLRRRRDIAKALGAPIRVTVGKVHKAGWLPGRRGLAAARAGDMPRLLAHLRSNLRDGSEAAAALAVVPVDNADVVALALVSLATSCAREGRRVVLADLADGAPAARLLRAGDPGIHLATSDGEKLVLIVPDPQDRITVGPIRPVVHQAQGTRPGKALAAACASADLLLTIATLDPALGAEHLATWTTDVVVVVTAGRSAAAKLKSTGEMIRLAGTHLTSAVLVGADKTDDSLGTRPASSGLRRRTRPPGARQSVSA